jgi:hypothetical protein
MSAAALLHVIKGTPQQQLSASSFRRHDDDMTSKGRMLLGIVRRSR